MSDRTTELADLFRRLGAPDPEEWARSQVDMGINQLARFVFLREAWKKLVPPDDSSWIDAMVDRARTRPQDWDSEIGRALERILAAGAERSDIHTVVRALQREVLFSICYQLADPGDLEPELAGMGWGLVELDADGNVVAPIVSLHESVLETDPAGEPDGTSS